MEYIIGEVLHGLKDPRKPLKTANIAMTRVEKGAFTCRTNFGDGLAVCIRPKQLEVHIIGLDRDIYGENLEITELKEIDREHFLLLGLIINGHAKLPEG